MALHTLDDLLIEQLRDLLDAEHRIVEALPNLAEAASHRELSQAFMDHLEQTETHVERLEKIFSILGKAARRKTCNGIKGLLEEGEEFIEATTMDPSVRDAGLIASAQRVEHYEMAGYGCAAAFARQLGYADVENLLLATKDEEQAADDLLTKIAEKSVNPDAQAHDKKAKELTTA